MRTREEAARFIEKQFVELRQRKLDYDHYDVRDLLDFIYGKLPKVSTEDPHPSSMREHD